MWRNPGETGGGRESNGVDDDGNGYVDDWRGWDWANDDNNPQDDMNHGTHVAGTIGALGNNGQGIAGVNWNVKIMALKFLDSHGDGDLADAVEALRYATSMGVRITNSSWGGGPFSQAMFDAIKAADAQRRAVRCGGREQQRRQRRGACLSRLVRRSERDRRRGHRPGRCARVVLEPRPDERRSRRARDPGLLDRPRRCVRLGHRHLDVVSARGRHGRARSGCLPERDRRRTEGAVAPHRRSEGVVRRRDDHRGAAQRGPRADMHRVTEDVARVAATRDSRSRSTTRFR